MTSRPPGPPSIVFLAYILILLPYLALRSAQRLRAADAAGGASALPKPEVVWLNTTVMLLLLFGLAWIVGRGFGHAIFGVTRPLGAREWLAAAAALAACLLVRIVARKIRPADERRSLVAYKIAPRTTAQWALWAITILVASVAEEAAYRGVGVSILSYMFGNPWLSVALCAVAFGAAHSVQGGRSMVAITAIALVMHGLVAVTGTLVLAMLVHAVYDSIAGWLIAREAKAMGIHGEAMT